MPEHPVDVRAAGGKLRRSKVLEPDLTESDRRAQKREEKEDERPKARRPSPALEESGGEETEAEEKEERPLKEAQRTRLVVLDVLGVEDEEKDRGDGRASEEVGDASQRGGSGREEGDSASASTMRAICSGLVCRTSFP